MSNYSRILENVLQQIETTENNLNKKLIQEFSKYLISKDTSANYQRNCIKVMLMFADFLQSRKKSDLSQVNSIDDIIAFLNTRRKTKDDDPEQKWITTWNDYLWRIKIFYRWYYNTKILKNNIFDFRNWITPEFINIPKKRTKRLSPYSESEIWEKDEEIDDNNSNDDIELEGTVTYVVDGDTLDINNIRIRLSLVDTPEMGQEDYKEAKDFQRFMSTERRSSRY